MNDERRARVLAAMADADLDALVLGREANARYVSGARRLWLAGARPFAPGCVVLPNGDVHLLSASDAGMPPGVPFEHLYPLMWNPANLMARLASLPGLASARTVGVDALTPLMESLLTATFPQAELRDAQTVLFAARRQKLPQELDVMRDAHAIAARALDDVVSTTEPGTTERDLQARFEQRMCELGTTTPAFEGRFGGAFPRDRPLAAGDRVVLDVGVLVDGYEGGLARTVVCGDGEVVPNPSTALFDELTAVIRPGASGVDLWDVWAKAGADRPDRPVAHGIGIGVEPPFIGPDADEFADGMTLTVCADVSGWTHRDTVVVTPSGAEPLRVAR